MAAIYIVNGARLRTSASRRYLIVSEYQGYARVEVSTETPERAGRLLAQYRREFPHATHLEIIDQEAPQ